MACPGFSPGARLSGVDRTSPAYGTCLIGALWTSLANGGRPPRASARPHPTVTNQAPCSPAFPAPSPPRTPCEQYSSYAAPLSPHRPLPSDFVVPPRKRRPLSCLATFRRVLSTVWPFSRPIPAPANPVPAPLDYSHPSRLSQPGLLLSISSIRTHYLIHPISSHHHDHSTVRLPYLHIAFRSLISRHFIFRICVECTCPLLSLLYPDIDVSPVSWTQPSCWDLSLMPDVCILWLPFILSTSLTIALDHPLRSRDSVSCATAL